jgi:hypothetical protein
LQKIDNKNDLSWNDIAEQCGYDDGEKIRQLLKRYRKKKGLLPTKEEVKNKEIENKEYQIELQKAELQKEKIKLSSLRNDLNRAIRESARQELLVEEFQNALNKINKAESPKFYELQKQEIYEEYVLSFSDVHFGKQFKSITNTYDIQAVFDRFNELLNEAIKLIQKEKIVHLTILNLADSVEGMCLRISQLQSLQIGMIDQVIQFGRFIVEWLNSLSQYVEITYYHIGESNHTQIRPFFTNANQFAHEDVEKFLLMYIHDMLQNNQRINVPIFDRNFVKFDLCGYKCIAMHGHTIKNPKNAIKDLSILHREFFDYVYFGHLHHTNIQSVAEGISNNCEIINVPSVMGSDEYADELMVGSKSGALLQGFNDKQGKFVTYDIILN